MNGPSSLAPDQRITQVIEQEIQTRMQPNADPISVAVQGATVTLTGRVANQATKDALIQMARGTEDVINITDNLVVGGGHTLFDWLFPWRDQNRDLEPADRGEW